LDSRAAVAYSTDYLYNFFQIILPFFFNKNKPKTEQKACFFADSAVFKKKYNKFFSTNQFFCPCSPAEVAALLYCQ
jgi:hypothetical protein